MRPTPTSPFAVDKGKMPCRFCYTSTIETKIEVWNQPLLESPNFYVIPSLGSLVEGWLLVVPKDHFIATAAIPHRMSEELWGVTSIVRDVLAQNYGPVWLFEHGPGAAQRAAGCGVDHAHFHLVPLNANLVSATRPFLSPAVNFRTGDYSDCRKAWIAGDDYLFAEPPSLTGAVVASGPRLGSQIFRKAIAQIVGFPDRYDWKGDSGFDNIQATIARVGAVFEEIQQSQSFETASPL